MEQLENLLDTSHETQKSPWIPCVCMCKRKREGEGEEGISSFQKNASWEL